MAECPALGETPEHDTMFVNQHQRNYDTPEQWIHTIGHESIHNILFKIVGYDVDAQFDNTSKIFEQQDYTGVVLFKGRHTSVRRT